MFDSRLYPIRLFFTLVLVAALSACANNVQVSSGEKYLANYPDPKSMTATTDIDAKVREVAAVEPLLTFPARIGLARIDRGALTNVPQAEADAWFEVAGTLGSRFGEVVPLSLLIAEMVAPDRTLSNRTGRNPLRAVIEKIRLGAARQHLDAVLVYEVYGTANAKTNPLSVADLTIIGAYLLPSRDVEATGFASGLLLDVRNGYPYGTAQAAADRSSVTTAMGSKKASRDEAEEAKTQAAVALTGEVGKLMEKLYRELGTKTASAAGK